ncbi:PH domain-containing protein [Paenibacillus larvae]|nr:PH domain-containing protein [Paenibacillus larvae]MDT2266134.1 PH domain-containing protein [Paenibacillus larvae]
MSNKERRSHPIHILVMWFNWLKGFLIPLLILGLSGNIRRRFWLLALITGLAVIVGLLTSFLQWRRFTYRLDEDQLLVRKGVFTQEEKFISFSKIQSVNMEESLFHRIYRLCSLRIETAGEKKKAMPYSPLFLCKKQRESVRLYTKRGAGRTVRQWRKEAGSVEKRMWGRYPSKTGKSSLRS